MALTPNEAYTAKQPFVDKETLEHIVEQFPTPFHLYDEAGIRRNMQEVRDAFAWNPGFKEYFAVKANPNPALISILNEYGCGCDCSSYTELMIARSLGITGHDIMFSSNDTPAADFELADKLGAIVNFDDISHIEFFERVAGPIPKTVSCRFNPGGLFQLSNGIMDNPGDSKYGMTTEQLFEAFRMLKAKGAEDFGIHAFLASNTVTNDYYPELARILFELAVRLERETGAHVAFINLSGGVGIPYLPEQQANDIRAIGEGVHAAYDEILVPAGILFTPFRVFVFFIFILFSFLFFLFPERNAVYKINHQNDHHPSQDLDHCHCIGTSKLGSRTGNGKLADNVTDTVGSCSSFCQEINLVIKKEAGGCSKNGYCF